MFIVATYNYGYYLELAITDLEKRGIAREKIGLITVDKREEERRFFDTLHRSDGISLLDGAAVMGTIGMLFGTIYGFQLTWGPVLWALIGLGLGALLGFLLDIFRGKIRSLKKPNKTQNKFPTSDSEIQVVLIVECQPAEAELIKQVLWNNLALGVGQLKTAF